MALEKADSKLVQVSVMGNFSPEIFHELIPQNCHVLKGPVTGFPRLPSFWETSIRQVFGSVSSWKTNISPHPKAVGKMGFFFPRWHMLVPLEGNWIDVAAWGIFMPCYRKYRRLTPPKSEIGLENVSPFKYGVILWVSM